MRNVGLLKDDVLVPQPKPLKPLLKYPGGKRWIVPYIKSLWVKNPSRRIVEPFGGGIAVSLALRPKYALINDINPHVINFYRQVKAGLRITIEMKNDKETYYRYRDWFNRLIKEGRWDTPEAAQLFYYLNHTGYNGLIRFNKEGLFNVPFGRYKKVNYLKDFSEYQEAFKHWEFTIGDFSQVEVKEGDFVFIDPPYDGGFTQYSPDGFTWHDQVRVARWASELPASVVIITNHATERIIKLYSSLGFKLKFVDVPRYINRDGSKRGPVKEVIAIKGDNGELE